MVELDNWIFQMKQYLALVSIEENKKTLLLSTFLTGEALLYFRTQTLGMDLLNLDITWEGILEELRQYFTPPNNKERLMDEWTALQQTGSVTTYAGKLQALRLQLGNLTDAQILDKFIRGLRTRTKLEVQLRQPATIEAAIEIADSFDRIVYNSSTKYKDLFASTSGFGFQQYNKPSYQYRSKDYHVNPYNNYLAAEQYIFEHNQNQPQPQEVQNDIEMVPAPDLPQNEHAVPVQMNALQFGPRKDIGKVICYNCGRKGHYANKCLKPAKIGYEH